MLRPATTVQAAEALGELSRKRRPVRLIGGRTHVQDYPPRPDELELETSGLNLILEHNVSDFTAVLQAGTPLRLAQAAFAESGQMLALDPPLGAGAGATVGGVLATADSGPSRHRYGGARDLVIGITAVLSDGNVVKAGGKVIKNVAGYDLAKLFAGSAGTLGLIADVAVRLHPRPRRTATVIGSSEQPAAIAAAAAALMACPLEADCLDALWRSGLGCVLVRFAGSAALARARETAASLSLPEVRVVEDDDAIWEAQRSMQIAGEAAGIKVAALPSDLLTVLRSAAAAEVTAVSRVALGLSWLTVAAGESREERIADAERGLGGLRHKRVGRSAAPIWNVSDPGARRLMENLKRRFDPAGILPSGGLAFAV